MNVHRLLKQSVKQIFLMCAAGIAAVTILAGCGGGSSSVPNPNPGGTPGSSRVAGTITDINGAPIVGAQVSINGQSTTSSQEGAFAFSAVSVPANVNSAIDTVTASKTISGRPWTGQNVVEILNTDTNTPNVNITMSDVSTQSAISGQVTDSNGNPLSGARVFAAPGPVNNSSGSGQYFTNLSSFSAYTDQNGNYNLPALPTLTASGLPSSQQSYTVTASFAGYINKSVSGVGLTPGNTAPINFPLTISSSPALPAVSDFSVITFTIPTTSTRAVDNHQYQQAYKNIQNYVIGKLHLSGHRSVELSKTTLHYRGSRSAPAGSFVESDLFWDYLPAYNLLGFDILRSDGDNTHFFTEALLRDPLGDRFADQDPALTPGSIYFYSVAPLDTINFPANGTEGPTVTPMQVSPLPPLTLVSPSSGQMVGSQPTLTWTPISSAGEYTVLIYNQFPDYQSDTNGVIPVISQNLGSASFTPSAPLASGAYYWSILAQYIPPSSSPTVGYSYSVSQIGSFVVP